MRTAIVHCLQADTEVVECPTIADWWQRWRDASAAVATPLEQALRAGFDADRIGWAFAGGYQAALRALWPALPRGQLAAFCVTEEGGNRPRDIRTRFSVAPDGALSIDGDKRWTTLGPDSSWLLVVGVMPHGAMPGAVAPGARPGAANVHAGADDRARPELKVACVSSVAAGLRLLPMAPTRFVPEVPHARVELRAVGIDRSALLPGDGYADYVKPFRTIEDIHVTLAVLAYLLREARHRGWPVDFAERVCALLVALAELTLADGSSPYTHIALSGATSAARALYAQADALWAATADDPAAQRWQRDAALFDVAASARAQRGARAWQRLSQGPAG
jgi:alkylation response protein AidB-like acyl-CoA dehydrogenase